MKRNDLLWKAALEDLFDDFLRFFFPKAEEIFDFSKKFQYLDKELDQLFPPENDTYAPRYVDKLVKVFTTNGHEEWILIHIEVQNYTDPHFASRMFQYYYRILDKYNKPITAFAIFADANKDFYPKHYEREFLGTKVYYAYNTFKIIDQDDAELEASDNPFAMAVLTAKLAVSGQRMKDEQLFEKAYDLAKRLLGKQIPKDKIRKLMTFLRYYVRFENKELIHKFEQEIAILTERSKTMGIEEYLLDQAEKKGKQEGKQEGRQEGKQEGRQEGRQEGKQEEAIAIAREMKADGIPIEQIAKFTKLSIEEIKKLS